MFLFHVCSTITLMTVKIFRAKGRNTRPFSNYTSPGDVVVFYLVVVDVPVALQPVKTVECLPVVVGERLVKATVDSVLDDEHSEIRSFSAQICQPAVLPHLR